MYREGRPPITKPEGEKGTPTPKNASFPPMPLVEGMSPPREIRAIDAQIRRVSELPISPPGFTTCDPQGAPERRLHQYLLEIEPILLQMARTHGDVDISVISLDKSRQNPLNMLFGRKGAGDESMDAYWAMIDRAASILKAMCGNIVKLDLIRVSPTSDEGIIIIAGRDLPKDIDVRFERAMASAKKELDLRERKYIHHIPGEGSFNSDLDAVSRVLRHREMIVSSKFSVSAPRRVSPDEKEGFILDEIRQQENREIPFFERLPLTFRVNDHGLAEVKSPFSTNLVREEMDNVRGGCFIEVKFKATDAEAREVLKYIANGPGWEGTRKGYSEAYSGNFGMRGFNTFIGKARTNSVLTPIAQAFGDLESQKDLTVLPVSGGYLQWFVEMAPNASNLLMVDEMIRRRIHSQIKDDPGYGSFGFEPHIMMLDADGLPVSQVRSRFILDSLGKKFYPAEVLDRSDFLLSFLEIASSSVQRQTIESLATDGGIHVKLSDIDKMQMVRRICSGRRTIRDTEDLIMVLRKDLGLHPEIAAKRGDLEQWLFDFSWENGGRIFNQLARRIESELKSREYMEKLV
jgi:hypothetical protein